MRRSLPATAALLIAWACFGLLLHWLMAEIDKGCTQFTSRGLDAECFAPAGQILMFLSVGFIVSSGALAYLAFRNR